MPNWREEYLSSIQDVELRIPVNMELVQACSQMADRISALEAENASLKSQVSPNTTLPSKSPTPKSQNNNQETAPSAADDAALQQLRLTLAEALRSKGVTETRLRTAEAELQQLRTRTKGDSTSLRSLETERATLRRRVEDREHELREKRKLIEEVQDEMITLNLQLSLAEKERDKVKAENKELVDRWMKRMGQEADAMNLANEPQNR